VGYGAVGSGIAAAFAAASWSVTSIDPYNSMADIQRPIEDLSQEELLKLLTPVSEIVYAAECANRDEYSEPGSTLSEDNKRQFAQFIARIVGSWSHTSYYPHVAYAGGSWTRLQPLNNIVGQDSPAKSSCDSNPYEVAKHEAASAASLLTQQGCSITFFDWISIVPNLAPNFTIAKMVASALETGTVEYSDGDFGRPLLHAQDAGRAVVMLAEERLRALTHQITSKVAFDTVVLPGVFTPFKTFAQIVSQEAYSPAASIALVTQKTPTPTFLSTRCEGSADRLSRAGFVPDEAMVERGLRETAKSKLDEMVKMRWQAALKVARTLPKAELHLHLDGSLLPSFLFERAAARGCRDLFPATTAELRAMIDGMKKEMRAKGGGGHKDMKVGSNWPVFDLMNKFLQSEGELEEGTRRLVMYVRERAVARNGRLKARTAHCLVFALAS